MTPNPQKRRPEWRVIVRTVVILSAALYFAGCGRDIGTGGRGSVRVSIGTRLARRLALPGCPRGPARSITPPFVVAAAGDDASSRQRADAAARLGEELFNREWVAGDARSPGGDGLGPVYNETSCVACHNLGGAGAPGPPPKTSSILSAISDATARASNPHERIDRQRTSSGHPGFATSTSVSLHRFGTDPDYENWRSKLLGLKKLPPPRRIADERTGKPAVRCRTRSTSRPRSTRESMTRIESLAGRSAIGDVMATTSERNTTPLFGSGLIDAIPDAVIEAAAKDAGGLDNVPRDPWPRQSACGRKNWPVRMEGPDGEARGLRLDRMCRRAGAGGARSSPIARPAVRRKSRRRASTCRRRSVPRWPRSSPVCPRPVERVPATKSEKERVATGRRLIHIDRLRDLPPAGAGHGRRFIQRPPVARHGPGPGRCGNL